jgi:hypothetical protein
VHLSSPRLRRERSAPHLEMDRVLGLPAWSIVADAPSGLQRFLDRRLWPFPGGSLIGGKSRDLLPVQVGKLPCSGREISLFVKLGNLAGKSSI